MKNAKIAMYRKRLEGDSRRSSFHCAVELLITGKIAISLFGLRWRKKIKFWRERKKNIVKFFLIISHPSNKTLQSSCCVLCVRDDINNQALTVKIFVHINCLNCSKDPIPIDRSSRQNMNAQHSSNIGKMWFIEISKKWQQRRRRWTSKKKWRKKIAGIKRKWQLTLRERCSQHNYFIYCIASPPSLSISIVSQESSCAPRKKNYTEIIYNRLDD